ncbi:hypothetical protein QAD02_019967 [Eretmocerus hayati]|uniref:Uncharacterized protein n=1 Tax=Eretmocerus hayati TaxID=131215 RepID=A0ACC2PKP7_9HYME|nr:hypothetical protein QAD02_019967 [Eretmocerus hayati]
MADVATKNKSMNVVSNNSVNNLGKSKMSDVCSGVQSNNGLIELERNGLSNNSSNNKLITLCSSPPANGVNDDENEDEDEDADLVLANNTRNELGSQNEDDKSLQELIESELALRICSAKSASGADSDDDAACTDDDCSRSDMLATPSPTRQPLITKKIVLQPRQDSEINLSAEFIRNEIDQGAQNGCNGHLIQEIASAVRLDGKRTYGLLDEDDQTESSVADTTTTSGPSLPSAFETFDRQSQHCFVQELEEEDQHQPNTLSDSCSVIVVEDQTTDEDSYIRELSHKSIVGSVDKQLLEGATDNSIEISKLELSDDEDSVKINEIAEEVEPRQPSNYDIALSTSNFISEDPEQRHLSLKEATGIDEKSCSFYSTEVDGQANVIDNDEGLDRSVSSRRSDVDVTDFKLKVNARSSQDNSWMTVADAVKDSSDLIVAQGDESLQDKTLNEFSEVFYSQESNFENYLDKSKLEDERNLAPIATPDEISDISNACDDVSSFHFHSS